ncbi:hypothetical protein NPIL_50421 [Nephila pilipes]|uniref:Uncharacterized protein n=1 Tax=Nephila pilipes TaxID=299642 RepID=A0A8X6TPW8_NEPPI|nr:hypothetical protein NPIL_482781 [Nephila pilipes]GFT48773.1 hypothetical protein NPIL_50421 [Nephila pilipes]
MNRVIINVELMDFYFAYGPDNRDECSLVWLYRERYPTKPLPNHQIFACVYKSLVGPYILPHELMLLSITFFIKKFFRKWLTIPSHMFDAECGFNMIRCHLITQDAYEIIWIGHAMKRAVYDTPINSEWTWQTVVI